MSHLPHLGGSLFSRVSPLSPLVISLILRKGGEMWMFHVLFFETRNPRCAWADYYTSTFRGPRTEGALIKDKRTPQSPETRKTSSIPFAGLHERAILPEATGRCKRLDQRGASRSSRVSSRSCELVRAAYEQRTNNDANSYEQRTNNECELARTTNRE